MNPISYIYITVLDFDLSIYLNQRQARIHHTLSASLGAENRLDRYINKTLFSVFFSYSVKNSLFIFSITDRQQQRKKEREEKGKGRRELEKYKE